MTAPAIAQPVAGVRRRPADTPALWRDALGPLVAATLVVGPWLRGGWVWLLDLAPGPRGPGVAFGAASLPSGPVFVAGERLMWAAFGSSATALVVVGLLTLGGTGAARLVRGPGPGRVVAGVAFALNPFVGDRLAAGQLAFLAGVAVLPWLCAHVGLGPERRAHPWRAGALLAIAAACSLQLLWIGGVIVAVAVAARRTAVRGGLVALGFAAAATAAWVAPLAGDARGSGGPAALRLFATRSASGLGFFGSVLSLQGFWRATPSSPSELLGPLAVASALAFATCWVAGAGRARSARPWLVLGALGVVLAMGASGPTGGVYRLAFDHLPGFAVMREPQKWSALVLLAAVVGLGRLARTKGRAVGVFAVVVLQGAAMVWGFHGAIRPITLPPEWAEAREALAAIPGDAVALPWAAYSKPLLADGRLVASVAPAALGERVLVSDDSGVGATSGDPRLAAVAAAVREAADGVPLSTTLPPLGVCSVIVVRDAAGVALPDLAADAGLRPVVNGPSLAVWRVASCS